MKKVYTKKELREIPLIKTIKKSSIPVVCPICRRGYLLEEEIDNINQTGMCYACQYFQKNKPRFVYWIEDKDGGGLGTWFSRKEAEEGLKQFERDFPQTGKHHILEIEAAQCHCGKWDRKDLIEGLGECLDCDHTRGDLPF